MYEKVKGLGLNPFIEVKGVLGVIKGLSLVFH